MAGSRSSRSARSPASGSGRGSSCASTSSGSRSGRPSSGACSTASGVRSTARARSTRRSARSTGRRPIRSSGPASLEPLSTGVRAIDGAPHGRQGPAARDLRGLRRRQVDDCSPCSPATARPTVNVIALIGERGREVQEFIDDQLGPDGLAKSVVIVATSDQPALLRLKAAERRHGDRRILPRRRQRRPVHDGLGHAPRDGPARDRPRRGRAAGAPRLPAVGLLRPAPAPRAGRQLRPRHDDGFFTVLVEGDDLNEPVADTVRSILDGHIVLTRSLAERNHYPAIDVLASISRVMPQVVDRPPPPRRRASARTLAEFEGARDLIEVGAYASGSLAGDRPRDRAPSGARGLPHPAGR